MKASIIILTYNNLAYTRQCLESIVAVTDEPDFELILVDNASQDQTPEYLRWFASVHPHVHLILNATNQGFAGGNNAGVEISTGEILVFLNNDTIVTQGWLKNLIAHMRDPKVGMVGPVTNMSGNETQIQVNYTDVGGINEFAEQYTRNHAGQAFPVRMLPFHGVVLSRKVFEEIGPLDEGFNIGMFEDDDYAYRLHQKGYEILCAEDAYVHHWGSISFSQLDFGTYWQLYRENLKRFEQKWNIAWQPHLRRAEFIPAQLRQSMDSFLWLLQILEERSQQISELQSSVNDLIEQLADRDQTLLTLTTQAADAQRAISWLNSELANIYQSNGWHFLQSLLRIRRAIIPEGSRREIWLRQFIHLMRDFRLENIKRLGRFQPDPVKSVDRQIAAIQTPAIPLLASSSSPDEQARYFPWPLVSIIIPVYNHADMLGVSARSVLNSTYPNLELIILDDGSTDNIEPVLTSLAADPRVRIYRQPNQKLPRALTHAHRYVRGELITWTSSDNWIAPQAIQQMVKTLLEHPEAVLVYADVAVIDEQGKPLIDESYRSQNLDALRKDFVRLYRDAQPLGYEVDNFINACFLYRSSAAQILEGVYADDLRGLEDYDFWLRLQKTGQLIHLRNQEPLYFYRVHTRTMSHELLSQERELHLLRGQRLIDYEAQRRNYCNQRWTLVADTRCSTEDRTLLAQSAAQLSIDLAASGKSINANPKSLRFLPPDVDSDDRVFVKTCKYEWQLIWRPAGSGALREARIWKGIQVNPLVLKARSYRKNTWEFSRAGQRPIIGCHLGMAEFPIDIPMVRKLIRQNPWAFFVFLDIPNVDAPDRGKQLVEGFENAIYLGPRPLWEPYPTYACFDATWLPPFDLLTAEVMQAYRLLSALAYAVALPMFVPQGLARQSLPYQYEYQPRIEELDYLQPLLGVSMEPVILDRYLASWAPPIRIEQLLRLTDAITQEDALARPDFGIKPLPVQAPTRWTPEKTAAASTLKCALVVSSLDRGGLEEIVANLALHLPDQRVESVVLCINEGGLVADRLKAQGVRVLTAHGQAARMWEFLEQEVPSVINSHQAELEFLKIAQNFEIPVIETIHNAYAWLNRSGWQLEKQRSLYFSQAIAVSESVKQYYLRRNGALAAEFIRVIPNGINTQNIQLIGQLEARQKLKIPEEAFVFLNLASYDGRKNQLGLLAAFDRIAQKYPLAQLICAGNAADPHYFEFVDRFRDGLKSKSQIQLYRFRQDTDFLLAAADVFVLDSFFEGWSLAASEAILAGLPLIHSECGSAYELVGLAGERGIVVPNPGGDPLELEWESVSRLIYQSQQQNTDSLVQALAEMLDRRETWADRRGEIRNFGLVSLGDERMLASYAEAFHQVLEKTNS